MDASGSGTNEMMYNYTIGATGSGQDSAHLGTETINAVVVNGGTIMYAAGKDGIRKAAVNGDQTCALPIDTTAPTVSTITAPTADDGPGTVVALTVNFSESVTVNTGGGIPDRKSVV